ncbi:MAG: class I SAM-dependent methyltransferase [Deltaproteobacteria bacterium]|jgi:hypothetical protein|nr:class I SAM-dependent methyltransferase [Deltaproteobacteria bacterium]MBW2546558.1 class I SAM-dependent methyltransferase [Deltaproteobacteria bacterium]MBW2718041.1 class I SAM-dependent methyltransferase [Deltaproteobacteria bacterium]
MPDTTDYDFPSFDEIFHDENRFLLYAHPSRVAKMVAHLEAYRRVLDVPGAIIECGVFKGSSFVTLATFRELLDPMPNRRLIGFDTFAEFPLTDFEPDVAKREAFIREAGSQSIGRDELRAVLERKGLGAHTDLVAGNILETLPKFIDANPELRVALLNLDTDIYEPARVILEQLWPRMSPGGVVMLDDYGVFEGETKAVDEYFEGQSIAIEELPYRATPRLLTK